MILTVTGRNLYSNFQTRQGNKRNSLEKFKRLRNIKKCSNGRLGNPDPYWQRLETIGAEPQMWSKIVSRYLNLNQAHNVNVY